MYVVSAVRLIGQLFNEMHPSITDTSKDVEWGSQMIVQAHVSGGYAAASSTLSYELLSSYLRLIGTEYFSRREDDVSAHDSLSANCRRRRLKWPWHRMTFHICMLGKWCLTVFESIREI